MAMSAVQRQDERLAFTEIITLHQQRVYGYLLRFTRNSHDAQDLFQETFLRAHRAYAALPADADLLAWLMRIAVNLTKNYVRDRRQSRLFTRERAGPRLSGVAQVAPGSRTRQLCGRRSVKPCETLAFISFLVVSTRMTLLPRRWEN